MATRKQLKKQINSLALELISDAFTYMKLHPGQKKDKVMKVVEGITKLRNEIIYKLNHPSERSESTGLKAYYNKLQAEMRGKVDSLSEELRKVIRSK